MDQSEIKILSLNFGGLSEEVSKTKNSFSRLQTPMQSFVDFQGATSKQLDGILQNFQKHGESLKKFKFPIFDSKKMQEMFNIPKGSLGDSVMDWVTGWFKDEKGNFEFWKTLAKAAGYTLGGPAGGMAVTAGIEMYEESTSEGGKRQITTKDKYGFSPPPSPGSTEAQSDPPNSATSGTLAADLPEGSWTAFFDKTAKVFDEALKAVIKGFDVALAKLVAGEGRRFAQVFAT